MAQKFKTPINIEELAATSTEAFTVKLDAESTERIIITADGKMTWGSGAATGDTTLYRSAANTLKTDDTFEASAGVVTMADADTPTASLSDGALAVDTGSDLFYFRSGGAWILAGGEGATSEVSSTKADGGTSAAWVRYYVTADGGSSSTYPYA
jgi:hypothetical protein